METGTANICSLNVAPGRQSELAFPAVTKMAAWTNDILSRSAAETGRTFIDLGGATQQNRMCVADTDRSVTDTTSTGANLPLHPPDAGNQFIAEFSADHWK